MPGFRPLLVPTLCFIPALALLVGLGVWQLERLQEKETLIASVAAGLSAAPEPIEQALAEGAAHAEWRHVRLSGRFLNAKEAYLFAQGPRNAIGVQVIAPFVLDSGGTILVNRGFVPDALRSPATREAGMIEGATAMTGVLRLTQKPGPFTPKPDPVSRLWYVKDVPAIAAALGVTVPAVIVEADATPNPGGWPLGGQTIVDFPNSHLQYALTWFSLALTLACFYVFYLVRQRRPSL
jgi:surfeit locus 1 family protein